MFRWKNVSHQAKLLAVFFLLSGIPAILIGTMAYRKSSEMLVSQKMQDLDVILMQLNASIERQISDFDRFTMLPYFMPEAFQFLNRPYVSKEQWGSAEINAQKTMVRMISAYPSINSSISGLMVYGMNGSVNGYRTSGDPAVHLDDGVREESWYKKAMAERGGFVITGVREIKQFTGEPFHAVIGSRLLMDDNNHPLAVIAIFISPEFIQKIFQSLQLHHGQITVLDSERQVIYASDAKLAARLLIIGSDQKKGVWDTRITDDTALSGGTAPITYNGVSLKSDYLGWKMYLGANRDEMLEGSRSIRSFTLATVVAVWFAAAAVSWLLARGLSKPIHRLIRSMREVEKGKFFVPASQMRGDEIGQLESSYGRMVQRLDELVQSIEEKERQKRDAELYALRARIHPHFLYNTLNSIRMLAILQQSSHIAKLIQSLNKLLHANMKWDSELVTLEDEIALLKEYAVLMDLRYTNVFEIEWHVPQRLHDALVPPMLLQPLLENAIFHGAKGLERKLNIAVEARSEEQDRSLIVEIRDDGSGFQDAALPDLLRSDQDAEGAGIGLRNVRDRIQLRFGSGYGLTASCSGGTTRIVLRMPYRVRNN
ncbi:Sensor histidine kinase YehU [Paenibacillus konkukensis]|uniref:Sensor histidine kinase YehU n=1 Tax=Paenibacillus konkukensis TaxID=2020716 RepID=A0ABY4RXX7_9BACL|nr:sensor histidine kinase [Paenibacillus konkukensis]UQZ86272.1 Sensor histidine kinase YehU [Paenibacillus konkukensis]